MFLFVVIGSECGALLEMQRPTSAWTSRLLQKAGLKQDGAAAAGSGSHRRRSVLLNKYAHYCEEEEEGENVKERS